MRVPRVVEEIMSVVEVAAWIVGGVSFLIWVVAMANIIAADRCL